MSLRFENENGIEPDDNWCEQLTFWLQPCVTTDFHKLHPDGLVSNFFNIFFKHILYYKI